MDPMLDEFRAVVAGLTYAPNRDVPTGPARRRRPSPEYWVRHVRDTVRFADDVTRAARRRASRRSSSSARTPCSPRSSPTRRPVLAAGAAPDRDEETAAVTALAALHVDGVAVDWAALFDGTGARRVELPTYAFQRQRFWPRLVRRGAARRLGLDRGRAPAARRGHRGGRLR